MLSAGYAPDLWSLGTTVFTCVIVTVTLRAALLCSSVTRYHQIVLVGSLASWCARRMHAHPAFA